MSCASCVKRVETVAERVPGVVESSVNLANESLTVRAGPGFSVGALAAAVRKAGSGGTPRTLEIDVAAMTCAHCRTRVEHTRTKVPGWVSASVKRSTSRAQVEWLGGTPPA